MSRSVFPFCRWLLSQSLVFALASGFVSNWVSVAAEEITPTVNPLEDSVDIDALEVLTEEGVDGAEERLPRPYAPLRPQVVCPAEPETLTELMLRDLPNYTNRVLQRTVAVLPWTEEDEQKERIGTFVRRPYRPSHVLIAGQLNLTPLDLDDYTYTTDSESGGPLTQVFFTTISRQYSGLRFNEVQAYHWLFLAQTPDGWRRAFMFSSIDDAQSPRAPLPPSESSLSSVGQAVQLWLRDCRAGAIDSEAAEPQRNTQS